jgi:hypothetical protein
MQYYNYTACKVIIVTRLSCWNLRRCVNKYLSNNKPIGLYTEGPIFGGGAYIRGRGLYSGEGLTFGEGLIFG